MVTSFKNDFTLGYCLFGTVKLTKNSYYGYGIEFDSRSPFVN